MLKQVATIGYFVQPKTRHPYASLGNYGQRDCPIFQHLTMRQEWKPLRGSHIDVKGKIILLPILSREDKHKVFEKAPGILISKF